MIREEIREYLRPVYDLERLVGRISYQSANPRDLIAFKSSLQMLPYIKQLLNSFDGGALAQIQEDLDPLEDLYQLVDAAIVDDPPYLCLLYTSAHRSAILHAAVLSGQRKLKFFGYQGGILEEHFVEIT